MVQDILFLRKCTANLLCTLLVGYFCSHPCNFEAIVLTMIEGLRFGITQGAYS